MADLYDPNVTLVDARGSLVASSNPDAWLAAHADDPINNISASYPGSGWITTFEDIGGYGMSNGSSFFDDLSGLFTGIGNAGNSLFDALGDIKGAQQEYRQGDTTALLAAQQASMLKYALIGGAILIAVLLLKD